MSRPAIVIVAWNRPWSLDRLLLSLRRAQFSGTDIPLVFSVDGEADRDVLRRVETFQWPHGPKEVILQPNRLGLKAHILSCGDLTERFGKVILLEEDLMVAPWFYRYAEDAIRAYEYEAKVAGISLYSHRMMESNAIYPFEPVCGSHGVYFIQYAVSWGQAWTARQWQLFRDWYQENPSASNGVASYLDRWPNDSWKKEFVRYLMATDRYFVCPGSSFTTNSGDAGTHFPENNYAFQVPLVLEDREVHFRPFSPEKESYDACFEPRAEWLQSFIPILQGLDVEIDLMGQKEPENISAEFVLTSRPVRESERSWVIEMRPLWQNLHYSLGGHELHLSRRKAVLPLSEKDRLAMYIRLHRFFYPVPKLRSQVFYEFLRGIGMMKK